MWKKGSHVDQSGSCLIISCEFLQFPTQAARRSWNTVPS